MRLQCLPSAQFGQFIDREPQAPATAPDLADVFTNLLLRANAFVPSEAAAILLDQPGQHDSRSTRTLFLAAILGDVPTDLLGSAVPARDGLVRRTYLTGRAHITPSEEEEFLTSDGLGAMLQQLVTSAICAPLVLGGRTIGAIELANHRTRDAYNLRELSLLEIFAQTISASIAVASEASRLQELSKRDDLTGLYNDRHLHRELSQAVAVACERGTDLSLLFIDLDRFKSVNDRWGHLIGSRVLREVAATIASCLPAHAIAARYGGDEFVVLLSGHGPDTAVAVAGHIRRSIDAAVFLEKEDPSDPGNYPALGLRGIVTCSIGAATLGRGTDAEISPEAARNRLVNAADACMYQAKARGRNQVVAAWDAG
jgi:diguanylate cyclase (GGDEF)-like protein